MTQSSALNCAGTCLIIVYIYVALVIGVPSRLEAHSLTTKERHPNPKSRANSLSAVLLSFLYCVYITAKIYRYEHILYISSLQMS